MQNGLVIGSLLVLLLCMSGACDRSAPQAAGNVHNVELVSNIVEPNPTTPPTAGPFDAQVRAIAARYRDWSPVYVDWRPAPRMCTGAYPTLWMTSEASTSSPHAAKVYRLFASDRDGYLSLPSRSPMDPLPEGFAVVKEAWTPSESGDLPSGRAPFGLFIVMKADTTEGTDDGWVYAMMSADGSIVHQAGRIETCMKCHADAENERLFGPVSNYEDTGFPTRDAPAQPTVAKP